MLCNPTQKLLLKASPFAPPALQAFVAVPTKDVAAGTWLPTSGSVLVEMIDEDPANDVDFIHSQINPPANDTAEVTLAAPDYEPVATEPHTVRYRYRRTTGSTLGSGGSAVDLTVQLMQGTTVIASQVHTGIPDAWTAGEIVLTTTEIGNITDYDDLRMRFIANGGGGGPSNRRSAAVSWANFVYSVDPNSPILRLRDWDVSPYTLSHIQEVLDWIDANSVAQTEQSSSFGSFGTSVWQFGGAVAAPNERVYFIPYAAVRARVLNPTNDTNSDIGTVDLTGNNKWHGGVLAPNGMIYGIPRDRSDVLKINPSNDSVTTFGSISGTTKYVGGVLAPNGKIYCVPRNATTILVIDPSNDTTYTFGSISGTNKYMGGVLAANGKIYCVPFAATEVLVIDPSDDSISTFGSLGSGSKWNGGVLAPNGKIYCAPSGNYGVLVINPTDNSTSIISVGGESGFGSGFLGANKQLYLTHSQSGTGSSQCLKVDWANDTAALTTNMAVNGSGPVLATNGLVFTPPGTNGVIWKLMSSVDIDNNFVLSREFNKY